MEYSNGEINMENVTIIDDFLPEHDFKIINKLFLENENPVIPWKLSASDYDAEDTETLGVNLAENMGDQKTIFTRDSTTPSPSQLVHMFYLDNGDVMSEHIDVVFPILQKIHPFSIFRIKANLKMKSSDILIDNWHSDLYNPILSIHMDEKKVSQWTTAVYYVNSNNGYTEFKDGSRCECVGNRLLTFPANMIHRGTSCTDEDVRVIINFNYFNVRKEIRREENEAIR